MLSGCFEKIIQYSIQASKLNFIVELQNICRGYLLGGVHVPRIYRMPGEIIVGDSGLCCCVPVQCVTSIVRAQLLPIVW